MLSRLWDNHPWNGAGRTQRMIYLGCMWGFDQSARYRNIPFRNPALCTTASGSTTLHSTITLRREFGAALARLMGVADDSPPIREIQVGRVQAASSKGKQVVKAKLIGRRLPDELQFLSGHVPG